MASCGCVVLWFCDITFVGCVVLCRRSVGALISSAQIYFVVTFVDPASSFKLCFYLECLPSLLFFKSHNINVTSLIALDTFLGT